METKERTETGRLISPKRIPVLFLVGIPVAVILMLYLAGGYVVRNTDLEYRSWAASLGGVCFFQGIPLWFLCVILWGMRKAKLRKLIAVPVGILLGALYVCWFLWIGVFLLFAVETEVPLQGDYYEKAYLVVDVENDFLEPASWEIYEPVWGVFRKPCERSEIEREYLERKYGEPFEKRPLTEEMWEYARDSVWNRRSEGWFSQSYPDVPVYVEISNRGLRDNYPNSVADKIAYENRIAAGSPEPGEGIPGGAPAEGVQAGKPAEDIQDEALTEGVQTGKPAEDVQDEALAEDIQAVEAEEIFRREIEPAGMGSEFTVCYNAKGFPYYYLGEDGTYAYTLVYDRESKNGMCRLYVLYRSPRNPAGDGYLSYTDTYTRIENVYAYETATGEIVPSDKKAWGDTGTAAYRRATGE